MLINNLPQHNRTQNFGFRVQVKENSKLVNMADSYLFRSVPKKVIAQFEEKAAEVLPDRNVHIEYSIWRKEPREYYSVNFFTDGKLADVSIGHDAPGLLNHLKKATNKYGTLHSRLFYNGNKSPETIEKIERFKDTVYRPLSSKR